MLLRVKTNDEGWNVADLLPNPVHWISSHATLMPNCDLPDVSLSDQDTSMVDTLRQSKFVYTGLKTALQEILDLKSQHVIELHARFVKDADTDKATD